MKPHSAPAAMPARIISGMATQRDVWAEISGSSTTALAPHAPMKNCPSAPMFHSRMRNASVHARPTRISGVAFTSVSEKTSIPPNDERAIWA